MKRTHMTQSGTLTVVMSAFVFAAIGCGGGDDAESTPAEDAGEDTTAGDATDGTGTDDISGADVEGDTDAPIGGSCEDYCARVTMSCTGDNAQFASQEACVAWCAASSWELGAEGDVDVPTLACHDGFAAKAESDKSACRDAGPLSVACGGGCQAYCEGAMALCGGEEPLYEAFDSCLGYCEYLHPALALTPASDTLGCRLFHLGQSVLGTEPAADACAAASPEGGDVCTSKPPPNDTCATAIVIESLPFEHDGDTSAAEPDYETGAGCCLPPDADPALLDLCALDEGTLGGAQNDVVYKLTAPTAGVYTFKSTGVWPRPELIYTAEDCGNVAATCHGASAVFAETGDQLLTLELTAGQTVFVFLDGRYGGDAGPYHFSVDPPCVPACGDAVCGDDGCGGSCGECGEGQVCTSGVCGEPTVACPLAETLKCGDTITVSTDSATASDAIRTYGCTSPLYEEEPSYDGSPELAYTLETAPGQRVTIEQTASDYFDLIVLTDPGDGCHVPTSPCAGLGFGEVTFDAPTETAYLVVDSPFGHSGETTVTMTCCTPDCAGKECGDDGCGGTCGECTDPEECTDAGQCSCTPSCEGRVCGDDGCGGSCGVCPDGGSCDELGQCGAKLCEGQCGAAVVDGDPCQCDEGCFERGDCCDDTCYYCGETFPTQCTCEPLCDGKDCCDGKNCGDDGCGGSCGECGDGEFCASFGLCLLAGPSCLGACGDVAPSGSCHCDADCFAYGDCCDDVCLYCDAALPAECGSCTPDCSDRECGDDGCGGSCGTCGAGFTCQEGLCGTAGDSCETAPSVAVGAPAQGDLFGADSNHDFDPGGPCEGIGQQALGPDRVFRFAPAASGFYEISVSAPDFDAYLWVGEACDAMSNSCIGSANDGGVGGAESVIVYVDAEAPVFVVVDTADAVSGSSLPFTLTVVEGPPECVGSCDGKGCGDDGCGNLCGFCGGNDGCVAGVCQCVPSCTGKVCGDDGCGGSCGAPCTGGLVCAHDQSACLVPGDSCNAGKVIDAVPYVDNGDTTNLGSDVESTNCELYDHVDGEKDAVYEFTPTVSGTYALYFAHSLEDGHPQTIYVVSDCNSGPEACVGPSEDLYNGLQMETYLAAGERVFIVIDGVFGGDFGPYTFTLELTKAEVQCEAGDTIACGDTVYGALGFTTGPGDIADYGCQETGLAGHEVVYSFKATETGPVTFTLDGLESDADLLVLAASVGDACIPKACMGASKTDASGSAEVTIPAGADNVYYVVVDGPSANAQPFYTLHAECGAHVAGDGCTSAQEVGALPFETTVTPSALQDDVAAGVCLGSTAGDGFGDAVLAFTPPHDGVYEVSLPNFVAGTSPSLLAVVPSCVAFTVDTCLNATDATFDATPLVVTLKGGEPVYILLDAYDASETGAQTIRVAEGCTPACGGKVCGSDGCGGQCGECDLGYICGTDGQCY